MSDRTSATSGTGDIRCPYFRAHGDRAIQCEAVIPGSLATTISYKAADDKKSQQQMYCEGNYKRCEMYITITHWQWPDEE